MEWNLKSNSISQHRPCQQAGIFHIILQIIRSKITFILHISYTL